MGTMAEELRQAGKRVVGGSPYTDRLEEDRAFGQQELKAAGVPIIPQENFTSFDEAIRFVGANPNRYVIKPSGEAQNIKRLLFVGEEEDGRDVIQVLEDYKRHLSATVKEFQLQRRIVGVEVAVGAFFNGKEFVTPVCVNFEHKKLFPGDIGPATGEMGTTMFWTGPNRLFNATLKKMESRLAQARFSSYIDINCIVNSNGIYPLEFTSRFGYPAISIQQEGLITPIGEVLQKLADGIAHAGADAEAASRSACAWWCRLSLTATSRPSRAPPRIRWCCSRRRTATASTSRRSSRSARNGG